MIHLKYGIVAAVAASTAFLGTGAVGDPPQSMHGARELGDTFAAVARAASPAVVSVRVRQKALPVPTRSGPFGMFPNMPHESRPGPQWGQGSGFVVDAGGLIMTNHHVVGGAEQVLVRFVDGRELEADVVGSDPDSDVAMLRVAATGLPALEFADSDDLQVGEWVIAIGNPFGLRETVTAGIVSAKGRSEVGIADHENFIQTDAAINPGNSGGPLLNLDGEIVGVNTAIFSRSGGYMGIGFAIPANLARNIGDQLADGGVVHRGFLGVSIQPLTESLAESFGLATGSGVLVAEVTHGSPAAAAKIEAGDVIVAVDGRAVSGPGALRNAIAMIRPGAVVPLSVVRGDESLDLEVTVGERGVAQFANGGRGFGFDVQPAVGPGGPGVIISSVDPDGPAARAGLQPGTRILSIDRRVITSVVEARAALAAADGDQLLLRVNAGRGSRWLLLSR